MSCTAVELGRRNRTYGSPYFHRASLSQQDEFWSILCCVVQGQQSLCSRTLSQDRLELTQAHRDCYLARIQTYSILVINVISQPMAPHISRLGHLLLVVREQSDLNSLFTASQLNREKQGDDLSKDNLPQRQKSSHSWAKAHPFSPKEYLGNCYQLWFPRLWFSMLQADHTSAHHLCSSRFSPNHQLTLYLLN